MRISSYLQIFGVCLVMSSLSASGVSGRFTPVPYGNGSELLLNRFSFDTREGEPELPAHLMCRADEAQYYIVQLKGPIYPRDRVLIESLGGEVMGYLPNYAFLVRMDPGVRERLEGLPEVNWVGLYHPAYKLSPELYSKEGSDTLLVLLFYPEEVEEAARRIEEVGGRVIERSVNRWNKLLKVCGEISVAEAIARLPGVRWVEPWRLPVLHNHHAQWVVQGWTPGVRRIWEMGIKGDGEIVSTSDSGIKTSHNMFRDPLITISDWGDYPGHRKVVAYKQGSAAAAFGDAPGAYYHGTHTGGTICGNDSPVGGGAPYDGMAPNAKLYFVDVGAGGVVVYPPADLNDLYILPYQGNEAGAARIMSNSWGRNVDGSYTLESMQTDQFMWNHKDFLIFFSAGNSSPRRVGSPASAKNCVTVGGTLNGESADMPYQPSSVGPTLDGRIKPTVVAPATLISAYGTSDESYMALDGTSMSSPCAAGAAALIRQYLKEGWYPGGVKDPFNAIGPSAALLKALSIVSADDGFRGHTVPSHKIGWGRVDLDSVLYFLGDERGLWLRDDTLGLNTGEEMNYYIEVLDQNLPLRVVLVWTDYPGDMAARIKLSNDLNLRVLDPMNREYKGNVWEGGKSITGGAHDSLNVEECVRVNTPQIGRWQVTVSARNVPYGPQPYAVVATGRLKMPEPYLRYDSIVVEDSAGINPNRELDPGETSDLFLLLRNDSSGVAYETKGVLRSESPYITIVDSLSEYGAVRRGDRIRGDGYTLKLDPSAPPGGEIPFQVDISANQGYYDTSLTFTLKIATGVEEPSSPIEQAYLFGPIIPNPFSSSVSISYQLSRRGWLSITIYDISGRRVKELFNGFGESGAHTLIWDGLDDHGRLLPSGVYFCRFKTPDYSQIQKLVRIQSRGR